MNNSMIGPICGGGSGGGAGGGNEILTFSESFVRHFHNSTSLNDANQTTHNVPSAKLLANSQDLLKQIFKHHHGASSNITIERLVREFCDSYLDLGPYPKEKAALLINIATEYNVNPASIMGLSQEYIKAKPELKPRLEENLRSSLIPPYVWLFYKIGGLEGGVKFLVDLRSDLLDINTNSTSANSALKTLNSQLKQLLSHWFTVGFLELDQVTWNSPCAMLQKVSDYEAVHPMRNWTDLKSRVGSYRRCFVYTHRSMPGEPIVVLHVALTGPEIPGDISQVVKHHRKLKKFATTYDVIPSRSKSNGSAGGGGGGSGGGPNDDMDEDPSLCQSAIFYSITSTQRGLQGIELGTYLIKQAVIRLKEEFPKMNQFCTLSPIPGFKNWLITILNSVNRVNKVPNDVDNNNGDVVKLTDLFSTTEIQSLNLNKDLDGLILSIKNNSWVDDPKFKTSLETPLMRLCSRYLYHEKRRLKALDSVANFHLRNGASLWRLNWKGDVSVRGLNNSCGMMVNYRYFLDNLEKNSSDYQEKHIVNASEQILQLTHRAETLI